MILKGSGLARADLAVGVAAAFIGCPPSGAIAQTVPPAPPAQVTPNQSGDLGDIVVTAQKRSESVQRVPLAVTAIGSDTLQQRGQTTIASIATSVPGLNVTEQIGQARITLRGIGVDNISTGSEGSVAFNQDGVFYSRSAAALASFYDVDRVEVLRGPQGTLYGRNATGGSVNVITNKPSTTTSGYLNLTVGNYGTINSEGALSGSLTSDLSGRISFQTQRHTGYGENIVSGNDIDNKNSQAGRAQLLYKPTSTLTVLVEGDYYRSHDRSNAYHYFGAGGETAAGDPIVPTGLLLGGFVPSDVRDIASARDPKARAQYYGGRIDINYAASDTVSIRSLSAVRRSEFSSQLDISPEAINLFPLNLSEKSTEITQEFQLNIDTDRNKFVGGLFYMHERINGSLIAPFNLLAVGGPDLLSQGFFSGGRLVTDAAAAYAQDTYAVTEKLKLTLGGRFSWERKAVDDQSDFDLSRPYLPSNVPLVPHHIDHKTFTSFTPKAGLEYNIDPDSLFYLSYSKGFKAGTYNLGGASPPLKPEKVDAYEAGIKSTLFDRRVRANVAGFYYNYKDLQVGKVQNLQLVLENAATAKIYGVEGEFTVRPIAAPLTLNVSASWLHARFDNYVTADQARPGGDGTTIDPDSGLPAFNLHGKKLPQAPDYSINAGAEYSIRGAIGVFTLRGESIWVGRTYFSPFNRDVLSQPAYSMQNLFVDYTAPGQHWHASAYVRNIGNKTILASGQAATASLGSPLIGFVQPPRTYGMTIGYRF
jgi:iron complex outermembrane recepter protein